MEVGAGHTLLVLERPNKAAFGYHWKHPSRLDGSPCDGVVRLEKGIESQEKWDVESGRYGITLKPSLLCERCGLHGFVTDGEWREVP